MLDGKRVLVTGASSGIGAAFVQLALAEGALVTGIARRAERLAQITHPNFTPVTHDLEASPPELHGEWEVVVCNAGRGCTRMPLEVDYALLDEMLRANVLTVMNTMQAAKVGRGGQYVIVGSILARCPYAPWRAAYSASKAALASLVVNWRQALAPHGVAVKLLNPGLTMTEFQQSANPEGIELPKLNPLFPSSQPQSAQEVAKTILNALGSDKDEFYTRPEIARFMARTYTSLSEGIDPMKHALTREPS